MGEPRTVQIRGGVIDGIVYLDAADVIKSLRLTAEGYRAEAVLELEEDEDTELADCLNEIAQHFECEADEYELICLEMVTEAVEEAAEEEADSDPV